MPGVELSGRYFVWGGAWWNMAWEGVDHGVRACAFMGWGLVGHSLGRGGTWRYGLCLRGMALSIRAFAPSGVWWDVAWGTVKLGVRACTCMGWDLVRRGLGRCGAWHQGLWVHGEVSGRSFAWGGAWWNVASEEVECGLGRGGAWHPFALAWGRD